jgi:hypothetical protein
MMSNSKLPLVLKNTVFFSLIICFCSFYSCSKKRASKIESSGFKKVIPATAEIYDLVNLTLKDYPFIGSIRLMEILPKDSSGYDFLFDREITFQAQNMPDFHKYFEELLSSYEKAPIYSVDKKRIQNVVLVEANIHKNDISWEEKSKTIEPFLIIYSPLFSADGHLAIISIDEVCFGLCGSGYTLILQKGTKNWEKVGVIYRWVS